MWERNIDRLPLVHAPARDQTCNPGMCPVESVTFCFARQCPTNQAMPVRAPLGPSYSPLWYTCVVWHKGLESLMQMFLAGTSLAKASPPAMGELTMIGGRWTRARGPAYCFGLSFRFFLVCYFPFRNLVNLLCCLVTVMMPWFLWGFLTSRWILST